MSTPVQATAIEDAIRVGVHDGRRVLKWDLGASLRGLTVAGISRALTATARWLDGLDAKSRAAVAATAPGVQVTTQTWTLPLVAGQEQKAADVMLAVLRQDGSIGRLPA